MGMLFLVWGFWVGRPVWVGAPFTFTVPVTCWGSSKKGKVMSGVVAIRIRYVGTVNKRMALYRRG